MGKLYPFRFEPLFRRYLWGGRRLEQLLRKPLGEGNDYAESWEVVDHGNDQSIVAYGPLARSTLHALCVEHGEELLGRHAPQPRFPLLFKFLDAQRDLSVQVHPNDALAARQDPPDFGKTEAWVVLHADPGSRLYAGLKRGFDRRAFERELRRGTGHLCLHVIEPRPGDCVFIPAGVVHAIGAGLVVAEIQQSSDLTYRLDDWGRVGPDGKPRPLHLEQGLAALDDTYGPVTVQVPQPTSDPARERLVACDKFVLDRIRPTTTVRCGGDDRFHIVSAISGQAAIDAEYGPTEFGVGHTILVPASRTLTLQPQQDFVALDMYLP